MFSHIGRYASKFCKQYLTELFLYKTCTNNIITTSATILNHRKNLPPCDTTVLASKKFMNPNIFQKTIRRLFCVGESIQNQQHNGSSRSNDCCGVPGHHKSLTASGLFTSSKLRCMHPTLLRTFATSTIQTQNSYATNYDFPVNPINAKSKSLLQIRTKVQPITQNYVPFVISDSRNVSEKVYRKIRKSCQSLVTDLMYSFPFNTHSDIDKTKESITPMKSNIGEPQNNSVNSIIDKLSTKRKHSIWSITDNFGFPSINRRSDVETLVKPKQEDADNISTQDFSIADI